MVTRKRKIVAAYQEELLCDNCGTVMVSTGLCLTSNPPQYEYECPKCKTRITTMDNFPRFICNMEGESENEGSEKA